MTEDNKPAEHVITGDDVQPEQKPTPVSPSQSPSPEKDPADGDKTTSGTDARPNQ